MTPARRAGFDPAEAPPWEQAGSVVPAAPDDSDGDLFNARRFLAEHGEDLRYVPTLGEWLVWTDGASWTVDERELVNLLAQQTVDGLKKWVAEASGHDEFKRRARHVQSSSTAARIRAMLEVARPNIAVTVKELDRDPDVLACPNGTVDLRSGELRRANRGDLITRRVDVPYDRTARSAEWLAFLDRIFAGDQDLVRLVQRLLGYALTGHTSEHVLPVWHGDGSNGKTQLAGAVQRVMGPYASVAADGLLTQGSERHEERIAALRGIRFVVSDELENRVRLAEALVKKLTGGDRLSARKLYRERFEFDPTLTIALLTNHRPRVSGTDEGIWRRVLLVPFLVTIPREERIRDYGAQLAANHGAAVLAWLIQGAVEWYESGLGSCAAVESATAAYREAENRLVRFLADRCVEEDTASVKVADLYAAWRSWCEANGEGRPGRQQDFTASVEARDYQVGELGYRDVRFMGLGLLQRDEAAANRDPQHPSMQTRHTRTREASL